MVSAFSCEDDKVDAVKPGRAISKVMSTLENEPLGDSTFCRPNDLEAEAPPRRHPPRPYTRRRKPWEHVAPRIFWLRPAVFVASHWTQGVALAHGESRSHAQDDVLNIASACLRTCWAAQRSPAGGPPVPTALVELNLPIPAHPTEICKMSPTQYQWSSSNLRLSLQALPRP